MFHTTHYCYTYGVETRNVNPSFCNVDLSSCEQAMPHLKLHTDLGSTRLLLTWSPEVVQRLDICNFGQASCSQRGEQSHVATIDVHSSGASCKLIVTWEIQIQLKYCFQMRLFFCIIDALSLKPNAASTAIMMENLAHQVSSKLIYLIAKYVYSKQMLLISTLTIILTITNY